MFLFNEKKTTPVIFNNFKISAGLAEIINDPISDKYIIKKSAFKPMHILKNNIGQVKEGDILKFSFTISEREVDRNAHLVTHANFNAELNTTYYDGEDEGIIKVPFLHIIINKPTKIYDTTPILHFTMFWHSTRHVHNYYDEYPVGEQQENIFNIIELSAASSNYLRYRSILWIGEDFSKIFKETHPRFETLPDRMGLHKIIWPNGDQIIVEGKKIENVPA